MICVFDRDLQRSIRHAEDDIVDRLLFLGDALLCTLEGDGERLEIERRKGEFHGEIVCLSGIGERAVRLGIRGKPLIREIAAEIDSAAVTEGELNVALIPFGRADCPRDAARCKDRAGRIIDRRDLCRCRHASRKSRPKRSCKRDEQRGDQGDDCNEMYFDLIHEKTPILGACAPECTIVRVSYTFYTNFPLSSSGKCLALAGKYNFHAIYTGLTNSEREKNFHGVSSAGGSERKRMRSLVTGCVNAREYAHSASLPLMANSPP